MHDTGSRDEQALAPREGDAPPFRTLWGLTRHTAGAGIAGVATGLVVGGVGGRLLMRAAGAAARDAAQGATTEAGFHVGEITFVGTLALVLFIGIFSGVAGAVYYLIFLRWLGWAGRWRGLVFGVVLFGATSATSDMLNPDNPDFVILRNETLLVGLIVVLFLSFGVLIDWLFGVLNTRLPPAEARYDPARFLYASLTCFGLLLASPVPMLLFGRSSCDCQPPVIASAFVTAAAVATVLWWLTCLLPRPPRVLSRVAPLLGYLGVGGTVAFGLTRATSDIAAIVTRF